MVHIAESTVGRRYAGWFIKNTERTQKILDDLKNLPLPTSGGAKGATSNGSSSAPAGNESRPARTGQKVAWGGVKVGA
jgi:translation initiation factor 3 subunit L